MGTMTRPARVQSPVLSELHERLAEASRDRARRTRPFVTLAYAQGLDGSIAGRGGRRLCLSGPESLALTHELRAAHDGILVGIGTVLTDDPMLNVRLVDGRDPQPVVVDSRLRSPQSAHLMSRNGEAPRPWLAATDEAGDEALRRVQERGATVLHMPSLDNGWVDLDALTRRLSERGLAHVLVEGGAKILNSFLAARLADYVVLTLAPTFVGGVPALGDRELSPFPRLASWRSDRLGDDLIVAGPLDWTSS